MLAVSNLLYESALFKATAIMEDKERFMALNKAIDTATKVNEAELAAVAKEGMPNIPGMDMFK